MGMEQPSHLAEGSSPVVPRPVLTRKDPNKKVSDEDREVLKALYCQGVPAPTLAERYGIKARTINGWASKEKWPSPGRVSRAQKHPVTEASDPAAALAQLWVERATEGRETIYQGAKKAIDRFFAMQPVPQTFAEAATAAKLMKEAINPNEGKDQSQTGISIQVLTQQGFVPKPVTTLDV
jgi:hypothetical protein